VVLHRGLKGVCHPCPAAYVRGVHDVRLASPGKQGARARGKAEVSEYGRAVIGRLLAIDALRYIAAG